MGSAKSAWSLYGYLEGIFNSYFMKKGLRENGTIHTSISETNFQFIPPRNWWKHISKPDLAMPTILISPGSVPVCGTLQSFVFSSHSILCWGWGAASLYHWLPRISVFTSTISIRKSWGVFPGSHSLPFSVLLCPISLAMGPCGLLCQLALLLAPCWVSDMTRDQRVGIRENLDISPSLSLSTILTVAAFQPWYHFPSSRPAMGHLLPTQWPWPLGTSIPLTASC